MDRGIPVVRLEPIVAHPDQSGRLRRLERAGSLRIGTEPPPLDLLREPAPLLPPDASAVEAIIDERRSGR
ncbi:hypothetical protein BH18CHL1_BH18CHL1_03960 [soil metagenome]